MSAHNPCVDEPEEATAVNAPTATPTPTTTWVTIAISATGSSPLSHLSLSNDK